MNKTKLIKTMKDNKLDAIFSASAQLRTWFTGINSSAGFLLITNDEAELIIDSRYIEIARKEAKNVKVTLLTQDVLANLKNRNLKRIGVEKEYVTLAEMQNFKKFFNNAEFINISSQELRIIKSENEIKLINKACKIALKSLEELKESIQPGVTELELERKLEFLVRKNGGTKGSFDAIVVSGQNGSLPHGKPSSKKLQKGELLTIDFGAIYKGYCSDITRTFHVGDVVDKKLLEIEDVVRKAQEMGVKAVKPGISTFEIDSICRKYITKCGYGEYFTHSTGHGLGIDVHELPNVGPRENEGRTLEPGMVITVEPGIYIPEFGGVRIEDDVLVTKNGYRVLSKSEE